MTDPNMLLSCFREKMSAAEHLPGDGLGCDPPGLRHHDVDVLVPLRVVVQHELGHLGRLAAAGVARDDGHLVGIEETC